MDVTRDQLDKFKELVYDRSFLSFSGSRENQLLRGLEHTAREGRYGTVDEYYHALHSDRQVFDHLLSRITTLETYFFRMPDHFEALRNVVLPELEEREGRASLRALGRGESRRMSLRAWSAGCATGQEAYSLSMQVLDSLRYPGAWDLKVVGTDINAAALDTARQGRYERTRMGSLPSRHRERSCRIVSQLELEITDAVREITEFRMLNLRDLSASGEFKDSFDIIFCRNVLIYLDLPAQQHLISLLSDCLRPGGHLFTGEGEVLHLYRHSFELREWGSTVFYRKPENGNNDRK